MKYLMVIFLMLSFSGFSWADDAEIKIIRMSGQNYKIWTDKNGIRRIDPIHLVKKTKVETGKEEVAPKAKAGEKEVVVESKEVMEADPGTTMVENMDYETCRDSLAAAEAMASVYNVIFDYPKGRKLTVLMIIDDKTVQLKCEYGTRATTTWEN